MSASLKVIPTQRGSLWFALHTINRRRPLHICHEVPEGAVSEEKRSLWALRLYDTRLKQQDLAGHRLSAGSRIRAERIRPRREKAIVELPAVGMSIIHKIPI